MIVTVLLVLGAAMLAVAAVLTVYRMSKGPTILDRVIAADVVLAIVVAGLATEAVYHRHLTTLPIMLVVSLVAFAGSLSMARFFAEQDRNTWLPPEGEANGESGPTRSSAGES
ncbi:MAG: monovalent cation/H+ antiporter complex subunit F [Propionibacteriales bacterium]|nr:monovalent cation/H+ antiporter complex subunit F [Propionibacteriales bacterium]